MENHFTIEERIQYLISKLRRKTKPIQRDSALQVLADAFQQVETISDISTKTYYLNQLAIACLEIKLTDKCLEILSQALEATQTISNCSTKVTELSKIGSMYVKLGIEDRGLELLDRALQLAMTLDNLNGRDGAFCKLAFACEEIGYHALAIEIAKLVEQK
ncbi:hypothetical protein H6G17_06680 [Chroococcidiopsis sp. FACHB-1243]|uniref:hypothetical protein n=1 Tax=Chroococcidiopsis sp. [FACHB-1243] TaxID=2692781 RepID=UPI00177CEC8F|nr:hypothetical protein [Chroococcidiopsis sp. [FACHB-1243]]MBD2305196.1 hypothetical protein [Chroococcidiopsis sp. [FACHB-1243]]